MNPRPIPFLSMAVLMAGAFCSGCAGPKPAPEEPPLMLSGFSSRETVGEEPIFDLKASQAALDRAAPDTSLMRIRDIRFTLFRRGRRSAVVSADSGVFHPTDKTVELRGRVVYNALDDSFQVRAETMAWDPKAAVLSCETNVEGVFRSYVFSGDRLDVDRARTVLRLRRATFAGPG